MKDIGARIKELRLNRKLTLEQLGNEIDFNYSNLSKIERGVRKPNISLLLKISGYFNKDIAYFFNEKTSWAEDDWLKLSTEMKNIDVSVEELKVLADTVAKIKNKCSSN